MSLIHEALKKVESAGRQGNAAEAGLRHDAYRSAAKSRVLPIAGALLVVVLLVITIAAIYFRTRSNPAQVVALHESSTLTEVVVMPTDHSVNGLAYYRSDRYRDALTEFEAGIKADPQDAASHNNAGLAAMASGDAVAAEAHFKDALRLRPAYPEALNNYGALLDSLSARSDDARPVEFFERALEIRPGYADAELNLAMTLDRLGKTNDAATHYERFIQADPTGQGSKEAAERLARMRSKGAAKRAGGR